MVIEWENIGQLSDFRKVSGNGIYFFVFDNSKIIYVGTAFRKTNKGLQTRLRENVRLFRCGGRTMRIPNPGKDIYKIFKLENSQGKELHECYKFWLPSSKKTNGYFISEFNTEFTNDWKQIAETYLNRITVYVAKMADKELGRKIESRLQYKLSQHFKIADYITTDGKHSGKFGKQEVKVSSFWNEEIRFTGNLIVDSESKKLLISKFQWEIL